MPERDITYITASAEEEFETGRLLFKEYVASLGIDLSFQGFDNELTIISQQYNKPYGALLLVMADGVAAGCAGVRRLDEETAELKRMYIKPACRGYGLGAGILKHSLALAKALGYKKIRLDTLDTMASAIGLYKSFGFYQIPAYRFNPLQGTVYMEKEL